MKKLCLLMVCLLMIAPLRAARAGAALFPAYDEETGLWGYIDVTGAWQIKPQYIGASYFRGNYAVARIPQESYDYAGTPQWKQLANDEGIIDCTGQFVVPPEYSFDSGYDNGFYGGYDTGIWLATRWYDTADDDDAETAVPAANVGFFDIPSGYFSGLRWYNIGHWCSEDSRLIAVVDYDKGAGYVDRTTGEMVIEPQYDWCDPANFHEGVASVAYEDVDDYFFLIDEQGKTIPLPEGIHSLYAKDASEGLIVVFSEVSGLYGYADLQGNMVIEPQFWNADDFSDGYAAVQLSDDECGYIDRSGQVVIRGLGDNMWHLGRFENGQAIVGDSSGMFIIDTQGNDLGPYVYMEPEDEYYNGLLYVYEDGKSSYINEAGECVFSWVEPGVEL